MKINVTVLKESTMCLKEAHDYIRQHLKNVDLEEIVGGAFDNLGYAYNIEDGGRYNIYLNDKLIIRRNKNATWLRQLRTGERTDHVYFLEESEFIKFLEIITLGANPNFNYQGSLMDTYRVISPIIQQILSTDAIFYPHTDGYSFKFKDIFYTVDMRKSQPISTLWELVKAINLGYSILDSLESQGADSFIKERWND